MGKLLGLKKWLTLEQAAAYLTTQLNEPVSQADVMGLALDRHLTLSIDFVNGVYARAGKAVPNSDGVVGIPFNGRDLLVFKDEIICLHGVHDLPMIGGEIYDCKHKLHKLTGGPLVLTGEVRGSFVKACNSETYYQIQQYFPEDGETFEFHEARKQLGKWDWKSRIFDDAQIEAYIERGGVTTTKPSRNDVFVIRATVLREFIDRTLQQSTPEKSITTTERNSLLTIIAALCDYSAINPNARGTSAQIAKLTQDIGAAVSDDTIMKALKKIPDALASRKK